MNVLYIHTHDTGRFIEPYGYAVPTPNLKALARSGILFRHAYCAAPTCSPSRAALLTGTWPHVAGMLGLAHRGFSISDYSRHMVQFLNRHGYETVLCGEQHEAKVDRIQDLIGYRRLLTRSGRNEIADIDNAMAVAEYLRNEADGPFFLSFASARRRPISRNESMYDRVEI